MSLSSLSMSMSFWCNFRNHFDPSLSKCLFSCVASKDDNLPAQQLKLECRCPHPSPDTSTWLVDVITSFFVDIVPRFVADCNNRALLSSYSVLRSTTSVEVVWWWCDGACDGPKQIHIFVAVGTLPVPSGLRTLRNLNVAEASKLTDTKSF